MAVRNLIITSATTGGIPSSVHFEEPPVVAMCPVTQASGFKGGPPGRAGYFQWLQSFNDGHGRVVPRLFAEHGGKGSELGRVCAMGFSNGCILVDELLKFDDAPQLDCVLAVDGIQSQLSMAGLSRWVDFGRYVAKHPPDDVSAPKMAITHSVIVPPNSPSTTQTADFIFQQVSGSVPSSALKCGFSCQSVLTSMRVGGVPIMVSSPTAKKTFTWNGLGDGLYDVRLLPNFYVLGWGEKDPVSGKLKTRDPFGTADHIFQGRFVLPNLIDQLVAKRWNKFCGEPAVSGFGKAFGQTFGCNEGFRYGNAPKASAFTRSAPTAAPPAPGPAPKAPTGTVGPVVATAEFPWLGVAAGVGGLVVGAGVTSFLLGGDS